MDELIVFLIRETGWTYEYTVQFIKKTPIKILNAFMDEIRFQRKMDHYNQASLFGMALSVWANSNSKSRKYKIESFVGQPPQRNPVDLEKAAEQVGIIMPGKKGG